MKCTAFSLPISANWQMLAKLRYKINSDLIKARLVNDMPLKS